MQVCYPATKPVRSAAPTFEPVTLEQAKKQLELPNDLTFHDPHLDLLIQAAREQVEKDSGIVCCTGTYTFARTDFPQADWFELPNIRPITAVASITYPDSSGGTSTFSSSSYSLDTFGVAPFIRLAYGQSWPVVRGDINGIRIAVTAGYATQDDIPARVKQAVLLLISHWYSQRSPVGQVGGEISLTYDAIITGLMRHTYA